MCPTRWLWVRSYSPFYTLGEKRCAYKGKFISFYEIDYQTADGQKLVWETFGRKANEDHDYLNLKKNFGGVDVIAIATQPEDGDP